MTKLSEVYVCELCGNIVEVLATGDGELVCCGQEMALQKENTTDASKEKHVPVVQTNGNTVTVTVGSVPHPMDASHLIAWIELIDGDTITRRALKAGDAPTATFTTSGGSANSGNSVKARAFCNLHGLWTS